MIWKKHRTRIANCVTFLQTHHRGLQAFLLSIFRLTSLLVFSFILFDSFESTTIISSYSTWFKNWNSDPLQEIINEFCAETINKPFSLWQIRNFLQTLQKEYPYIQNITVSTPSTGKIHLTFQGVPLLCCINDNLLLDVHGKTHDQNLFNKPYVQSLAQIKTNSTLKSCTNFKKYLPFLCNINFSLWNITITSPEYIIVQSKESPTDVFIVDLQSHIQIPQEASLILEMKKKAEMPLKKNHCFVFDMRFKNQIVVSTTTKGGVYHGEYPW